MKPKPTKIFVKLNEVPKVPGSAEEECRISKIQLSSETEKDVDIVPNVLYEADVDMATMLSLKNVPEIDKVTVRTPAVKQLDQSDVEIDQNQSIIE